MIFLFGNFGLGLLRIGFGETVNVEKMYPAAPSVTTKEIYSTIQKVMAVALFIIAFPVTLLIAAIGCIGVQSSKSYPEILEVAKAGGRIEKNGVIADKLAKSHPNSLNGDTVAQAKQAFEELFSTIKPEDKIEEVQTDNKEDVKKDSAVEHMYIDFADMFLGKITVQGSPTETVLGLFQKTLLNNKDSHIDLVKDLFFRDLDLLQQPSFMDGCIVAQAKSAFEEALVKKPESVIDDICYDFESLFSMKACVLSGPENKAILSLFRMTLLKNKEILFNKKSNPVHPIKDAYFRALDSRPGIKPINVTRAKLALSQFIRDFWELHEDSKLDKSVTPLSDSEL